ncbi:MAG: transcription antitermination factor NusB [Candidatus Pacebacteria bacterium]|nr:transcription antitermination factor NusB [Candidatus Paceibacterota bacterium]
MKTALDPRHIRRKKAVKALFASSFSQVKPKNKLVIAILAAQKKIDKIIKKTAPEWPLEQINKIDLAILRLATYELAINPKEPPKAIIDEAVELGKKYGGESTPAFINGVLGAILKKKGKNGENGKD